MVGGTILGGLLDGYSWSSSSKTFDFPCPFTVSGLILGIGWPVIIPIGTSMFIGYQANRIWKDHIHD